jgi:UDP-glucuronate 4-epimerase
VINQPPPWLNPRVEKGSSRERIQHLGGPEPEFEVPPCAPKEFELGPDRRVLPRRARAGLSVSRALARSHRAPRRASLSRRASRAARPNAAVRSHVLITGAAGFIGHHLALSLAEGRKVGSVVGLDNYSPYYSVALKRARAARLGASRAGGVRVVEGDVCNRSLVDGLLREHRVTHVVHLAAQAGVRYSLRAPLSYVRANVECFVSLLEALRAYKDELASAAAAAGAAGAGGGARAYVAPQLVYASSSSVYGLNRKIPFSEADPVEVPANLYGATKRADELIAFSYHHLHRVHSVGLRLFTVYGPWGRPDMAAYIFSRAVELGQPLTV